MMSTTWSQTRSTSSSRTARTSSCVSCASSRLRGCRLRHRAPCPRQGCLPAA
jgi:hypothetical protein